MALGSGPWIGAVGVLALAIAPRVASRVNFGAFGFRRAPRTTGASRAIPTARIGALDLDVVDDDALARGSRAWSSPRRSAAKRALDIALAIAFLVALAPLLILVAIVIRLDSPGPALYRQRRIGRAGAPFSVYKFRSMSRDAERDGARYASIGDPRITRVGHFIRRTRIDEIPQAINVLRGEMSFVGPRPERPEFVEELRAEIPHYDARHLIKPGITGWAQVRHEYTASVAGARRKLQYDLYYVQFGTLASDLMILAMTVRVVLFGVGSR